MPSLGISSFQARVVWGERTGSSFGEVVGRPQMVYEAKDGCPHGLPRTT
jgi:hypothetical protein